MPSYVMSLDPALHVDHAALAIVEQLIYGVETPFQPEPYEYSDIRRVVYLQEWPLGTSMQTVIADIIELTYRGDLYENTSFIYDKTGTGVGWSQSFRKAWSNAQIPRRWRGVVITGEQVPTAKGHVRQVDLMEILQLTSNEGRLQMDPRLHLADKFAKQLQAINVKHSASGRLSYGAPQAVHDDLVQAVSLGVRYGFAAGEPRRYGTEMAPALDPFRASQKLDGPAVLESSLHE